MSRGNEARVRELRLYRRVLVRLPSKLDARLGRKSEHTFVPFRDGGQPFKSTSHHHSKGKVRNYFLTYFSVAVSFHKISTLPTGSKVAETLIASRVNRCEITTMHCHNSVAVSLMAHEPSSSSTSLISMYLCKAAHLRCAFSRDALIRPL